MKEYISALKDGAFQFLSLALAIWLIPFSILNTFICI